MTLLIQRVLNASVQTGDQKASIEKGLLVLVSFHSLDTFETLAKLAKKVAKMRIFDDANGKLNLNVNDVKGQVLLVPNFTLEGDALAGHRPSFSQAKAFDDAENDFHLLYDLLKKECPTFKGFFGAPMTIRSTQEGPVNLIVRSH
jgi:D-tyrosyl-tRNA(Tyr) deacylase